MSEFRPELKNTIEKPQELLKSAKVFIYSGGCTSNWLDGQQIIDYLNTNGHQAVDEPAEANVIIINTCAVDDIAKKGSFKRIADLKAINPDAKFIVAGCLPEAIDQEVPGAICLPPKDLKKFDSIFDHQNKTILDIKRENEVQAPGYWTSIEKYFSGNAELFKKTFAFSKEKVDELGLTEITGLNQEAFIIETSKGCLGNCSYCAIKRSRGDLKSNSLERIVEDFNVGLKRGFKEFKIWGDDVGDYGKDIGIDLADLLAEILKKESDFRLEILAANPKSFLQLYDKLLPLLRDKRIACLNITVQSGSEKILKAMNRAIDIKLLIEKIKELRQEAPYLQLRSHYLVGFPGETRKDFEETLKFISETKIFQGLIFEFDSKPGTPGAEMSDQISEEIKKERREELESFMARGAAEFYSGKIY